MDSEKSVFCLFVVDKRKSPDYQELRGFVQKKLSLKFKGICKGLGQDINQGLEEAIQDWIEKQHRQEYPNTTDSSDLQVSNSASPSAPTIASLIEETLSNRNWVLKKFSYDSKIPIERVNGLLKGSRPDEQEIQALAQVLIKPDGEAWEEVELVDIRLAEDLKKRQIEKRAQHNKKVDNEKKT